MTPWPRAILLLPPALVGFLVLGPLTPSQQSFLQRDSGLQAPPQENASPQARLAAARKYTLLFVGDIMLSRGVGSVMKARGDWLSPFRKIAGRLLAADLAFGNLECPISDQGRNLHHLYSFRANPRALEGLKEAGFRVVSQANNHAYDWGPQALLDSLQRLRAAGIETVGAGQNDLQAHYPAIVDLGGLKVAFLAYVDVDPKEATAGVDRPGVAWLEPERVLADIRFARPLADLLVVCPHWGVEYATTPTRGQVNLARRMIDAGADVIVGSHPHVTQPLEHYHGRWIAYSLGNFVFDQKNPATHRGLMLKVKVLDKQIVEVAELPITINPNFQAVLALPPEKAPRTLLAKSEVSVLDAK